MITTVGELKEYFRPKKNPMEDGIFVGKKVRKDWMLNHETTVIAGRVYGMEFQSLGGGVWRAVLSNNTMPHLLEKDTSDVPEV